MRKIPPTWRHCLRCFAQTLTAIVNCPGMDFPRALSYASLYVSVCLPTPSFSLSFRNLLSQDCGRKCGLTGNFRVLASHPHFTHNTVSDLRTELRNMPLAGAKERGKKGKSRPYVLTWVSRHS